MLQCSWFYKDTVLELQEVHLNFICFLKRISIWKALILSSSSSSSSSYCWASVANARMYCSHIVQPLDVPALTANLLLWGPSGQRWRCLWTFLFSNVPTFATSRLREILAAKCGTAWARNGRWIFPENARLPRNIQGSFTFRKPTTWDRRLYFPSEGRRAGDFFSPWKIQRLQSCLNPRTWVPKTRTLPLDHRNCLWKTLTTLLLTCYTQMSH